jgi:acyl carrier protein
VPPALAEIWGAALGSATFRADSDFFLDGGDSLLSLRLTQEINATFDTELEPAALFRLGTSLAAVASAVADGQRQTAAPLRRIERTGRLPISPSQRGIWYEQRLGAPGLNTVLALELARWSWARCVRPSGGWWRGTSRYAPATPTSEASRTG